MEFIQNRDWLTDVESVMRTEVDEVRKTVEIVWSVYQYIHSPVFEAVGELERLILEHSIKNRGYRRFKPLWFF